MSTGNKHINYSVEDIQRYLNGKMTPQEMHALEKASLDDEFLADAIEGYSLFPDENHQKALALLKEEIATKTITGAKVVDMKSGWRQWYRIAAVLFIMLGSAAIIYKYVFTNNAASPADIAKTENKSSTDKESNTVLTDSNKTVAASTPAAKEELKVEPPIAAQIPAENYKEQKSLAVNETTPKQKDSIVINAGDAVTSKLAEVITKADDVNTKDLQNKVMESKPAAALNKEANNKAFVTAKQPENNYAKGIIGGFDYRSNQTIFKGRVVDKNNEPLPFARIAIKNDSLHIGTYADVKGNFSFVAADSVLEVDAMSVGYFNNTVKLQQGLLTDNKIVLKESSQSLSEVTVTGPKIDRRKAFGQSEIDTSALAEPIVGWSNYDTYITNNLVLPEKEKFLNIHGTIELSFSVDKNGTPGNITVEKSLVNELDSQAIKVLKEGPKWKSRKKNTKGKIVLEF
ncbi:MAG: carboxypeptidase-like regulatory domain-containing protein [Sphingobacteriales bacterium]|nr:carboxypeptidase-like regulatory domain-containing protein [Sphingobacteriales bacterium]